MGDWNLGSVADTLYDYVPEIPTALSGTRLLEIADRSREYVSSEVCVNIGSNAIGIKYQNAILYKSITDTVNSMNLIGADVEEMQLGDWKHKKGAQNNLTAVGNNAKSMLKDELKSLGTCSSYYKANG